MSLLGNIHSFESFGTVDGPGIRFVIFAQGCPLRCFFCHNPDTWSLADAPILMSAQQLFEETLKYKTYIQKRGGVTFSGGEPLLQASFIAEYFRLCKQENLHTTLDTSGCILNDSVKELLQYTDLVLLDIKTINPGLHKKLTGISSDRPLTFLEYLNSIHKPTWIRHVVIPGLTYNEADLKALGLYLKGKTNIEKIELLPYHTFGSFKYRESGINNPLENTPNLTSDQLENAQKMLTDILQCSNNRNE